MYTLAATMLLGVLLGCAEASGPAPAPPREVPTPVEAPPAVPGVPVAAAAPAAAVAAAPNEPARMVILGAGDVIPHTPVLESAERHGWASLFAEIAPRVQAADLAIVNLETPIAPVRDGRTAQKVFNAPVGLPVALRDAGFDGAALGNNHVWDQSRAGLLETVANLETIGLAHAGAGRTCDEAEQAVRLDRNGFRVAWLSTTRVHNLYLNRERTEPCVFRFELDAVLARVAEARAAGAELVVLSLHWGVEYETTPRSWDESFAKKLVASGVDVILAHHPHVLQPARWIEAGGRRGVAIFSLGNLMAAQGWTAGPTSGSSQALRRDSGLFEVTVERVDGQVRLTDARLEPLWIEHRATGCRGGPTRMRAVPIFSALTDPVYAGCGYAARLPVIRRVVGADFVRAAP